MMSGILQEFWVVEEPSKHSTLGSIFYKTTPNEFFLQMRGRFCGANPPRVEGTFWTDPVAAKMAAKGKLEMRDLKYSKK